MTVRDYHAALDKITASPLQLTEADFDVLADFNPADEQRGRAALCQAQLAIVANAETMPTKANAPRRTANISNTALADGILAIAKAIGVIGVRLAEFERREANQTAAVAELRKGLIDARGALLALEHPRPEPYIDMHANDPRH